MKTEDTELLEALAVALAPPAAEPTPAELAVLAHAVADSRRVASPARRPSRPVRRTVVVAVVGSIVLSAGTAAAVGAGAPLPRPLRAVADAVGLPVDSVALADARTSMADLRHALEAEDPPWVTSASDELREDLYRLSTGERDEVEPVSTALLERAAAFLADQPGDADSGLRDDGGGPEPDSTGAGPVESGPDGAGDDEPGTSGSDDPGSGDSGPVQSGDSDSGHGNGGTDGGSTSQVDEKPGPSGPADGPQGGDGCNGGSGCDRSD